MSEQEERRESRGKPGNGRRRGAGGRHRDGRGAGYRSAGAPSNTRPSHHRQRTNSTQSDGRNNSTVDSDYPPHTDLMGCQQRYAAADATLVRGKLRVLPAKDAASFLACDRGLHALDILIPSAWERNRAMHGDTVYVELLPEDDDDDDGDEEEKTTSRLDDLHLAGGEAKVCTADDKDDEEAGDVVLDTWQDDGVQMALWNPVVPGITRPKKRRSAESLPKQRKGKVIAIVPPKAVHSELEPSASGKIPNRRLVGSMKVLQSGTMLLTPNNNSLPQFKCPPSTKKLLDRIQSSDGPSVEQTLFRAEYKFGAWKEKQKWPPCINVDVMGECCVLEDEIQALLVEYDVDHGDFPASVLKNVDEAVQSGLCSMPDSNEQGWKPTPEMYQGRRDYRSERIFTIDPTTAKDLDGELSRRRFCVH